MRHTTVASKTIDSGFYGVGLPHVGVEATIAMTNKLLMHFGCGTATGRFMQISLFITPRGTRHVVSTVTGGLQKIQSSRYTHMDDAVGKGFHVWDNSDHHVSIRRLCKGRG